MSKNLTPNPYGVSPSTSYTSSSEAQNQEPIPVYKSNTLAITSLVLGILSILFYFLTAIPGIITGHMARSKAKKMPDRYEGQGMALAGLILSYIMLIITIVFVGGAFYMFTSNPEFKDIFMEGMREGFPQAK